MNAHINPHLPAPLTGKAVSEVRENNEEEGRGNLFKGFLSIRIW